MIIKYSKYTPEGAKVEQEGFFITEGKDSVRVSKSGKAYSFLVNEKSIIIFVGKDGKEVKLTGKELINKLF